MTITMISRAALAAVLAVAANAAGAAQPLTLQLNWTPRAEFAGYIVARDQGFYADEGLDVTIRAGGPGITPADALATGAADVAVDWMVSALMARDKGLAIVNIAQPITGSSLRLVCLRSSGIAKPDDLRGQVIGASVAGGEAPLLAWLNHLGLSVGDGPDHVTLRDQAGGIDALIHKRAACIPALDHAEMIDLENAALGDQTVVFSAAQTGAPMLEDGLYVLEPSLRDPERADRLARFVRASMKGWRFVAANPAESAAIVAKTGGAEAASLRAIEEVIRLTSGSSGALDPARAAQTAELLRGGVAPLLSAAPEGAWTSAVTDRAKLSDDAADG